MGNLGVNDRYVVIVLSGILLWFTLGTNAEVGASELCETDSTNESLNRRHFGRRSADNETPTGPSAVDENKIPTMIPGSCGDPKVNAKTLYDAFEKPDGRGDVVAVLSKCTRSENQVIRAEYWNMYDKDLVEEVKYKYAVVDPNLYKIAAARIVSLSELLADQLYAKLSTGDLDKVRVILGSLDNNPDTADFPKIFYEDYENDIGSNYKSTLLPSTLMNNLPESLTRLMDSQIRGFRSANETVDPTAAYNETQRLLNLVDKNGALLKNDERYNNMMFNSSFSEIREIDACMTRLTRGRLDYLNLGQIAYYSGRDNIAIDAYNTIILFARGKKIGTFAEEIYEGIGDRQIHNNMAIFIIAWRADIDLGSIKRVFRNPFNHRPESLYNMVKKKVSGHYGDLLLAIVGQ